MKLKVIIAAILIISLLTILIIKINSPITGSSINDQIKITEIENQENPSTIEQNKGNRNFIVLGFIGIILVLAILLIVEKRRNKD